MQWTRVCLSKDSNTSLVRLVVDGELLVEEKVKLDNQPEDLDIVLGWSALAGNENPGQMTNLNIFSIAFFGC